MGRDHNDDHCEDEFVHGSLQGLVHQWQHRAPDLSAPDQHRGPDQWTSRSGRPAPRTIWAARPVLHLPVNAR